MSYLIDIDDTLVSTRKRTQGLWKHVLGCVVPLGEIETMTARQIFERYATEEQKPLMRDLQRRFTETMLCKNVEGVRLMELDEPIPYAANVLHRWWKEAEIVYITGRLERVREETASQLRRFGFPVEETELVMFKEGDWRNGGVGEARRALMDEVVVAHSVHRVVDDFPGYFTVYRDYGISERIGLLQSKMYKSTDFLERGATKVVKSWSELIE
jgi:hypothetical protein